ncbi:MAG TPA: transposase [Cyclobacteriaceae bacterium]|nr:transposase [Cyclobacteriaceae bacterium]
MTPGAIYHVYNHGNGSDNLFRTPDNYRYFMSKYWQHTAGMVQTYAYCLMPNHFHFLVAVRDEKSLRDLAGFKDLSGLCLERRTVQQFSNFFNSYAKVFNRMHRRRGKLFLTPFRRKPVNNQHQFINTWKYILFNPVHHGFVEEPKRWAHSSIHHHPIMLEEGLPYEIDFSNWSRKELIPDWAEFLEFDY